MRTAQDTLLLSSLLPVVRSNGGQTVFRDAHLKKGRQRYALIDTLNDQLRASRNQEMSAVEFQKGTADVLGPLDYGSDVQARYDDLVATVLGDARDELSTKGWQAGVDRALERWREWNKSFGRRGGHEVEKEALNILSYECRTALHTCYSATWCELIKHLAEKYKWTEEAILFHELWHLDLIDRFAEDPLPNDRLFHGHVFGLHPASADFICTTTGRDLIGNYLAPPSEDATFRRCLHGMYVAVHDYANRIATDAENRVEKAIYVPGND